jgi:hypothetical protein
MRAVRMHTVIIVCHKRACALSTLAGGIFHRQHCPAAAMQMASRFLPLPIVNVIFKYPPVAS